MSAVAQVVSLAEQLAAMTDERDHYKRELGMIRDKDEENRVAARLGLTIKQSSLLMTLYARRGRLVTKEALMDAMYNGVDEPEIKIIDVFVCKIRKTVASHTPDAIETLWGRGYMLTEAGVAMVEKALRVGTC